MKGEKIQMCPKMVSRCPGWVTSTSTSTCRQSLDQVGGERLFVFLRVAEDDLHHGDVRPREEADEPHHADDHILGRHQRRQALCVEGDDLQDGREDQGQEAAADRAHQRDDQVQLRYQDGQGAWRRTDRGDTW